ncbi:MAG TPA: endonuclease III [Acidisarcina sp.]
MAQALAAKRVTSSAGAPKARPVPIKKSLSKGIAGEVGTPGQPQPRKGSSSKKIRPGKRDPLDPTRISAILDGLAAAYPNAECALRHGNPWELLVATILSAQCTDARVNLVTPVLFQTFPTPAAFAEASLAAIEEVVRPTGFFRNKAKSISGAARRLVAEYKGEVPRTMEELLTLPGVARKTANVVLGVAFKVAVGVVVDTHVLRLSSRLELTKDTDPKKVEQDLMDTIPQDHWIAFSHEMIHHGRQVCVARKPRCVECTIERVCCSADKTWSSH